MTDRKQLIEEANELELEFKNNIPTTKLQALVDEANGIEVEPEVKGSPKGNSKLRPRLNRGQRIKHAKERALKLHVVTITNKDNRENDVMTTVHLSFENAFFGISREVPLDIPVQIEAALIEIAESTMMTLHKDEIVNGARTGNKVPMSVKKFAVSYGNPNAE